MMTAAELRKYIEDGGDLWKYDKELGRRVPVLPAEDMALAKRLGYTVAPLPADPTAPRASNAYSLPGANGQGEAGGRYEDAQEDASRFFEARNRGIGQGVNYVISGKDNGAKTSAERLALMEMLRDLDEIQGKLDNGQMSVQAAQQQLAATLVSGGAKVGASRNSAMGNIDAAKVKAFQDKINLYNRTIDSSTYTPTNQATTLYNELAAMVDANGNVTGGNNAQYNQALGRLAGIPKADAAYVVERLMAGDGSRGARNVVGDLQGNNSTQVIQHVQDGLTALETLDDQRQNAIRARDAAMKEAEKTPGLQGSASYVREMLNLLPQMGVVLEPGAGAKPSEKLAPYLDSTREKLEDELGGLDQDTQTAKEARRQIEASADYQAWLKKNQYDGLDGDQAFQYFLRDARKSMSDEKRRGRMQRLSNISQGIAPASPEERQRAARILNAYGKRAPDNRTGAHARGIIFGDQTDRPAEADLVAGAKAGNPGSTVVDAGNMKGRGAAEPVPVEPMDVRTDNGGNDPDPVEQRQKEDGIDPAPTVPEKGTLVNPRPDFQGAKKEDRPMSGHHADSGSTEGRKEKANPVIDPATGEELTDLATGAEYVLTDRGENGREDLLIDSNALGAPAGSIGREDGEIVNTGAGERELNLDFLNEIGDQTVEDPPEEADTILSGPPKGAGRGTGAAAALAAERRNAIGKSMGLRRTKEAKPEDKPEDKPNKR